jgi:hypothetical protein
MFLSFRITSTAAVYRHEGRFSFRFYPEAFVTSDYLVLCDRWSWWQADVLIFVPVIILWSRTTGLLMVGALDCAIDNGIASGSN